MACNTGIEGQFVPGKISSVRLNLGCSDKHEKGYINVDRCEPADVIADLSGVWPWRDSSVAEIKAFDIIEHLPDKIHTMNEAWRVLCREGRFSIAVPTTDGPGAWQDPTHVSYWNLNSFMYYEAGNPHRERFGKAYGVVARFRTVTAERLRYSDGVVKLLIVLGAVK